MPATMRRDRQAYDLGGGVRRAFFNRNPDESTRPIEIALGLGAPEDVGGDGGSFGRRHRYTPDEAVSRLDQKRGVAQFPPKKVGIIEVKDRRRAVLTQHVHQLQTPKSDRWLRTFDPQHGNAGPRAGHHGDL
jgi:hypothetical protein